MSNKLKLLVSAVCIVAAAVCIGLAGRSYLRVREIDRERVKISSASVALEARIRQDGSKAREAKKRTVGSEKGEVQLAWAAYEAWKKMFNEDIALQSKRLAAFRAEISVSYGPFFQKLHLSPEQRSRLADALVRRQADTEDLNAILASARQTPDDADGAWRKIKQESLDVFDATAVSVLGEEGRAQLEVYEQDKDMWDYVGHFASVAAQSGIPFSLQQADQLVALMSSATSTPGPGTKGDRLPQTESDWAAIDEQAKTFLSKEQLDLFRGAEPVGVGRFVQRFDNEWTQAEKDAGGDTAK